MKAGAENDPRCFRCNRLGLCRACGCGFGCPVPRAHPFGAFVPQLWHLEVSNILLLNYRKGRHGFDFVERRLADLTAFVIEVDETHLHAWNTIARLAAKHPLTSYDAAYLELALRRQLPLATLDKALIRAAEAEAVPLFWSSAAATN